MTRNSWTASGRRVSGAAQAGGVVAPVELEVDGANLGGAGAVDVRELLRAAQGVRGVVPGHAAGDAQERIEVAVDEGEVQDLVLAHGARERGGRRLHEGNVGHDGDDLGDLPGLDDRIDAGVAADLEQDAGLREVLEAGERDLELVAAHGQEPELVVSGNVRDRGARELGAQVGGGHLGRGHRRPRAVLDVPQDRSRGDLGRGRGREEEGAEDAGDQRPDSQPAIRRSSSAHDHPPTKSARR